MLKSNFTLLTYFILTLFYTIEGLPWNIAKNIKASGKADAKRLWWHQILHLSFYT